MESDDDVRYKFDPLYGFVQVKKEGQDEPMEPMEEQEYKYVPYVGFVPLTAEDKASEDLVSYKFNPFYGFVEAKKEGKRLALMVIDERYSGEEKVVLNDLAFLKTLTKMVTQPF